ncbi:MAG: hypothetical protein WA484_05925 [Solirubrobacteraceae bacterium]
MSATPDLGRLERIIDASGVSERIEALLPVGVRPRQLTVRTLLIGMLLTLSDKRPAHLARVHEALIGLPGADRRRLGVIASWKTGPHELTYRQTERTFALVVRALSKEHPDGRPSETLSAIMDRLSEASVGVLGLPDNNSLAIDWTGYESFARPPRKDGACADPEAAWGHRKTNHPGRSETFFGYHLQAATIVKEENGPEVGELVRRITLSSCKHDPPAQIVPVIERMTRQGIEIADLLGDSGYAYRAPETFAMPARALGANLVIDLHPNDRGCKGTHQGAIACNGNLYCPATPQALFELGPLAPGATEQQTAAHDKRTAELARYKLSPLSAPDPDGYHRAICPAAAGKIRCPLRPSSMSLSHERPTITDPPEHPPACCEQQTITVPPTVNTKTTQKHDWPSQAHRLSYARRTAAERSFSQVCDPASNDISRGWSRLMGLTPNALMLTCAFIVANIRTADAFTARQAENQRRAERGLPPRKRARRRRSLHDLIAQANAPPAKANTPPAIAA